MIPIVISIYISGFRFVSTMRNYPSVCAIYMHNGDQLRAHNIYVTVFFKLRLFFSRAVAMKTELVMCHVPKDGH